MSKRENRIEYNAYMNAYMTVRYRSRRREAKKKLGGKCSRCGSTRRLEFDHLDPKTKYKVVAKMWSYSEERFWDEVGKCQLLCRECHQEKSLAERGLHRAKGVHGNYMNYSRYGCRCDQCKSAWTEKNREYKRRYRERKRQESGGSIRC
jgi:hypothetical protein